ncbi:MAG: TIGR00159 family protein [Bacteroidetes bacterium QH_2_64_74]|nr:MAG: TIGR00159 family protein [Bacteroidetes bacterium QH_2_64_74]
MKVFEIIDFGIGDAIEILLVAYILYQLYRLMRGTIAVQIALGLGALFLVQFVVELADMTVLTTVFGYFNQVFVLAVIIIFQPEIRRLLLLLGRNPIVRRFVTTTDQSHIIDETVGAVDEMSERQIGALIAFQRDGAVVINNGRVEAARCILPVSTSMKLSPQLGLRHRAAVGLTEQTDAFVVVVSEETGDISVSRDGALISNITPEELRTYLTSALTGQSTTQASATAPATA